MQTNPPDPGVIRIVGARQHNLQSVNVEIPRNRLVVMTGVSGSGKSSLAFDTLYAEGQRRYVESLSAHSRQFLEQLPKPDVELIEGLSPTIAIEQRSELAGPRATVATVTEIHDYLRVLFARVGVPVCRVCRRPIQRHTVAQIADRTLDLPEGSRVMVLAPLVRDAKGGHQELIRRMAKQGVVRLRIDGQVHALDDLPPLAKSKPHSLDAVLDRLTVKSEIRQRLSESVELAMRVSEGYVILSIAEGESGWRDERYSRLLACPEHPEAALPELTPQLFSFNSPQGMCMSCNGLGASDQRSAVSGQPGGAPPRRLSSSKGRGGGLNAPDSRLEPQQLETRNSKLETDLSCPACHGARLRPEALHVLFENQNIAELCALDQASARRFFDGVTLTGERELIARQPLDEIRRRLRFLCEVGVEYLTLDRRAASLSGGEAQRIRLATQIGGGLVGVTYVLDEPTIGLHQRDAARLVAALRRMVDAGNSVIVVEHDEEVIAAADHIIDIGPGAGAEGGQVIAQGTLPQVMASKESVTARYLRRRAPAATAQRHGVGVTKGGTSVVVQASRLHGAAETAAPQALTTLLTPNRCREPNWAHALSIRGASKHNLKNLDVRIPLGLFVCVTGVSGSGKSTLVSQVLLPALQNAKTPKRQNTEITPQSKIQNLKSKIEGAAHVARVVEIDQSPIGRSPRSNPATYVGIFDQVRKLFAATRDAKLRGWAANRFSFNVAGGRCEDCEGQGVKRVEMHFLPDVYTTCATCKGTRYNRETLEVRYRGMNIAQVLEMRVEEATDFFQNIARIHGLLTSLLDVGLGYVALGQPSSTLSGGEAQRIKLAAELGKPATPELVRPSRPTQSKIKNQKSKMEVWSVPIAPTPPGTLYLLDEPTTGLHFADVERLLVVLNRLVDQGNSLLVVEHNLDVIAQADWIIDLGPEAGDAGGRIVAEGPPASIAASPASHTGRYLAARSSNPAQ